METHNRQPSSPRWRYINRMEYKIETYKLNTAMMRFMAVSKDSVRYEWFWVLRYEDVFIRIITLIVKGSFEKGSCPLISICIRIQACCADPSAHKDWLWATEDKLSTYIKFTRTSLSQIIRKLLPNRLCCIWPQMAYTSRFSRPTNNSICWDSTLQGGERYSDVNGYGTVINSTFTWPQCSRWYIVSSAAEVTVGQMWHSRK